MTQRRHHRHATASRSLANRRGLTLVEMLVVAAIISLLSMFTLEAVTAAREYGLEGECSSRLHQTGLAFETYRQEYRLFPEFAPPLGLGDQCNWSDLWQSSDPMNQFFCTNQTNFPRVPRLLALYAGDVRVLHCPCQGATGFWMDVGPYHYNTTSPWDGVHDLWTPVAKMRKKRKREPLAACTRPPQVQTAGYSWRHGERTVRGASGANHHLFANQAVLRFVNPQTWNARR